MTTSDDDDDFTDLSEWTTETVKQVAHALSLASVPVLHASSFSHETTIPFKAMTLRELLLHRMSDLMGGVGALCEQDRIVPALILVRAAIEVSALTHRFRAMSRAFLDDGDKEKYHEWLKRVLAGSKNGTGGLQAINVLTVLDQINKQVEGIRTLYDRLSEYAHPNRDGMLGSYGAFDAEKLTMQMGKHQKKSKLQYVVECIGMAYMVFQIEVDFLADIIKQINDKYETGPSRICIKE